MDNLIGDQLLCYEMGATKPGEIVVPQMRRSGDAVGKVIHRFRGRSKLARQERTFPVREVLPRADLAQQLPGSAEGNLLQIGLKATPQSFPPPGVTELVEQLRRGNFLAAPSVKERLLGNLDFCPAERNCFSALPERLDHLPGGLVLRLHAFR